jgi:hypothetical protein
MRDIHQAVRAQRLVIANIELALLESRRSKSRRDGQTLCDSRPHRETSSWSATTMSELKSGTTGGQCAVDQGGGGRRVTASRRCGCLDGHGRQLGARSPNLPQTPSTGFGRTASVPGRLWIRVPAASSAGSSVRAVSKPARPRWMPRPGSGSNGRRNLRQAIPRDAGRVRPAMAGPSAAQRLGSETHHGGQ